MEEELLEEAKATIAPSAAPGAVLTNRGLQNAQQLRQNSFGHNRHDRRSFTPLMEFSTIAAGDLVFCGTLKNTQCASKTIPCAEPEFFLLLIANSSRSMAIFSVRSKKVPKWRPHNRSIRRTRVYIMFKAYNARGV